jgi:hypothetical protein
MTEPRRADEASARAALGIARVEVVQHVPNYVDGVTPKRAILSGPPESLLGSLLALDWIARLAAPRYDGVGAFHQWSISRFGLGEPLLVAERDGGSWWWIAARLRGDVDALGLPDWNPPEKRG